ncbi:MAG: methylmalonyl Co-A mutase-associated GTPase MeaB [Gammaproteobacteria bacterium]|nr:methylmalonyl Co-A mutase-associated GTPase MeaB [Gammaproteobacteria bacterium]
MTDYRDHSDVRELAASVADGARSAVARALNLLDDSRSSAASRQRTLFSTLTLPEQRLGAHIVGFTGPPGAGKSTLISSLIAAWREQSLSVGVIAADPSSPLSGGALLGDRLRMRVADDDAHVFIRSVANRGSYGGLTPELLPMAVVMCAAFDRVVIETVGVGQREVDVAFAVDTTCLVVQPGAGDNVQYLKAGIMEIPDLLVVTKADLGPIAERARNELMSSVMGHEVPVLSTSAVDGRGIGELRQALNVQHHDLLAHGALENKRRRAQAYWLVSRIREEFGRYGLARVGGADALAEELVASPGSVLADFQIIRDRVIAALGGRALPNNHPANHAESVSA